MKHLVKTKKIKENIYFVKSLTFSFLDNNEKKSIDYLEPLESSNARTYTSNSSFLELNEDINSIKIEKQ